MILIFKISCFVREDHMIFTKISPNNSDKMKQLGYRYPPLKNRKNEIKGGVSIGRQGDVWAKFPEGEL